MDHQVLFARALRDGGEDVLVVHVDEGEMLVDFECDFDEASEVRVLEQRRIIEFELRLLQCKINIRNRF